MTRDGVAILGIFVADLAFRAGRLPLIGETIAGSGFAIGPGGQGSNQAGAAAPGAFDHALFALSDYVVPNETEAEALTGIAVADIDAARRAGDALIAKGAGTALVTLGERGALFHNRDISIHIPPFAAGPVVETTGAGDAFVGCFAAALARGVEPIEAARFGSAGAGNSVTRARAAPHLPRRAG